MAALEDDDFTSPRVHALYRCVGCGAMGVERDCLGPCDFRKLVVVEAQAYADLWQAREDALALIEAIGPVLTQLAGLRDGEALRLVHPQAQGAARAALRAAPPPEASAFAQEVDVFTLWRCAVCGQAEAPQECLGVCVRPVRDYVEEEDFLELSQAAARARLRAEAARALLRDLAWTRPREGQWDAAARRLREMASAALTAA